MSTDPHWQPGDPLYPPPNAGYNRQPFFRLKEDQECWAAPARWPTPFMEDELDIIMRDPQSEIGYFA